MITTGIGYGLAALVGARIVFIGARFLLAPGPRPRPTRSPPGPRPGPRAAYLAVKGVRHIASGLFVFILITARQPSCSAGSCWPPASSRPPARPSCSPTTGPKVTAYAVHGATAALMLATASRLLASPP